MAARDVHRLKLFGRWETHSAIAPFDLSVAQATNRDPRRSARRVFWIMDNGSSHRGLRGVGQLQTRYAKLRNWCIEPFAGQSVQPLVNASDSAQAEPMTNDQPRQGEGSPAAIRRSVSPKPPVEAGAEGRRWAWFLIIVLLAVVFVGR